VKRNRESRVTERDENGFRPTTEGDWAAKTDYRVVDGEGWKGSGHEEQGRTITGRNPGECLRTERYVGNFSPESIMA